MSKRVVIVGAGIIGLSAAVECLERGHEVVVIERNPQQRTGCSFGNAGMIVPSHFVPLAAPGMVALGLKWMWNPRSPFYIKPRLSWDLAAWAFRFWRASTAQQVARAAPLLRDLHLASRAAYARHAAASEDFGLVQKGLLMLCKTDHALEEEARYAARARELGIPAEVLDAKDTAALDPGARMDVAGSVYFPKDCHMLPECYVAHLERQIAARRGAIRWGAEVIDLKREGRRLMAVATTKEDIEGDEFVVCAGAWTPHMVRALGLRVPMEAGKGYSLTLPDPIELPQVCSILTEARVAVTPMNGMLRVGGTMELAGMDESINPRRIEGIVRALPQYYPAFRPEHFAQIRPWQGLRPCSPDGLPYLGRSRAAENLVVATGHAMMGVSLAPVTGELVAKMVDGEKPAHDLSLLDPDRFA